MGTRSKHGSQLVRVASDQPAHGQSDLLVSFRRQEDGALSLSTAQLPTPHDVYVADAAWVKAARGAVSFFFAKLGDDDADPLRSKVEVRWSLESFAKAFWENSREFHEQMKLRAKKRADAGITPAVVRVKKIVAEKNHSMVANVSVLARMGTEASIDFFHFPPRVLAQYMSAPHTLTGRIPVVPLVRILLSTDTLTDLLDCCAPIVEELQPVLANPEIL